MNRGDVIRMAREAGLYLDGENTQQPFWVLNTEELERFAALVAAAEREAVLDLVDDYAKGNTDLRDAIRARGNT